MIKRYQYWSQEGIKWTDWFEWDSDWKPEFQLGTKRTLRKLLNEYKDENICPNSR